jgi:hypothetical protein
MTPGPTRAEHVMGMAIRVEHVMDMPISRAERGKRGITIAMTTGIRP